MQEKNEILEPSTQEKLGDKGARDAALIADLQLGQVEEVYTLDRTLRGFIIFLVVVSIVLFPLCTWLYALQMGFPLSLIPALATSLIPLLLIFPVRYRYGGMHVYICSGGLLYLWRKKRESMRWDEVKLVRRHFVSGGRSAHTYIWLISRDERKFSLDPPDRESQLLTTLEAKGAQYGFEVSRK